MSDNSYTNIHQAKTHLSKLIEKALNGEEVIIAKAGKPLVKMIPFEATHPKPKRVGGQLRGKIWIADDFDAPDPELESLFYDGPVFPKE